ncbi:unnamed protein product [Polarella glacialis]|uniref:Uncharacterized protein n=1 Tax=Polarella glacialis TaxID=89957 RepID=A0A813J1C0_POLGL|nr:unnamed protein product [Polarella glacialis]
MGDDLPPTQEEVEEEPEVQADPELLDIFREFAGEPSPGQAEVSPPSPGQAEGEPQSLLPETVPAEELPDWGQQEDEGGLDDPPAFERPRRGKRAGVKVQKAAQTKAAALARSLAEEAASAARRANQLAFAKRTARAPSSASASSAARAPRSSAAASSSGGFESEAFPAARSKAQSKPGPSQAAPRHQGIATARGRSVPAACSVPQLLSREQRELRNASRSRSAASDRCPADRPRRPDRRREPSLARDQRKAEARPEFRERIDADYRDRRVRGQFRGPDYGTVPAAKPSQRRPRGTTAGDRESSAAPPGQHWAPVGRPGSVRAPRSPSPEPEPRPPQHSAAASGIIHGSASRRRRSQSVSWRGDRPEQRLAPSPPPDPVRTDLPYLEAQAALATAN